MRHFKPKKQKDFEKGGGGVEVVKKRAHAILTTHHQTQSLCQMSSEK